MRPLLVTAFVLAARLAAADDAPLVDVATLAPGLRTDLRYATADNVTGAPLTDEKRCLLRAGVARRLARVQAALEKEGLALLVWDCHRTKAAQAKLWAQQPDRRYVADPKRGSHHQRGAAVDLTLADRAGKPLEMPTPFDEGSERAHADAKASPAATKNRARLRTAMTAAGFVPLSTEWWHFTDPLAATYPIVE